MRLIDADELKMHMFIPHEVEHDIYKLGWNDAILAIVDYSPTIDPVKHGRWLKKRHEVWDGEYIWSYRCSECSSPGDGTAFCPNCGAYMMDGGEDDERIDSL